MAQESTTSRLDRLQVLASYIGSTKPSLLKVGNSYKCTLCKKTGDYAAVVPHVQTHSTKFMSYRGRQMYRCGLDCSLAPHHHCCFCNKVVSNKRLLMSHLEKCEEGKTERNQTQLSACPTGPPSGTHIVLQALPGSPLLQTVRSPLVTTQGKGAPVLPQTKCLLQAVTGATLVPVPTASKISQITSSSQDKAAATTTPQAKSSEKEQLATAAQTPTSTSTVSHMETQTTGPLEPKVDTANLEPVKTVEMTPTPNQSSLSLSDTEEQPLSPVQPQTEQPSQEMANATEQDLPVALLTDHMPSSSNPEELTTPPSSPPEMLINGASSDLSPDANLLLDSSALFLHARARIKCPHCPTMLLKRNLKVHVARNHKDIPRTAPRPRAQLRSVCVDPKNGILAVQRQPHSLFLPPVHAQRAVRPGQVVRCDLKECHQYQQMARRHGLVVSHCQHTRHLDSCQETAPREVLKREVLQEMVAHKLVREGKRNGCLRRQAMATAAAVPLSVLVELGASPRYLFVSVHEPKTTDFSCMGRVMVGYNVERSTWSCPCAKPGSSCVHKNIAKWHIFQNKKDLFKTPSKDAGATWNSLMPSSSFGPFSTSAATRRSVEYLYKHKRIPADLPEGVTSTVFEFSSQLFPTETTCAVCPKKPALGEAENVTEEAKIVTMIGVASNVLTYVKRCPDCQMLYRYQEWQDGLHNFNNHLLLSIELCLYFRHSLQNNIPVSTAIKTLEKLRKMQYPAVELLLNAYSHFEALMDSDDTSVCSTSSANNSSPMVVMDLHRKAFITLHWN